MASLAVKIETVSVIGVDDAEPEVLYFVHGDEAKVSTYRFESKELAQETYDKAMGAIVDGADWLTISEGYLLPLFVYETK